MEKYIKALMKLANQLKDLRNEYDIHSLEERIFSDRECLFLIDKFQKAKEEYEFVIKHFPNDKKLIAEKRNIVLINKKNMDQNNIIKEYNDKVEKLSSITMEIEAKLHEALKVNGDMKRC